MDKTNRNKDAVTQRILETTQETERLKQELQNLIAAGISGSKNYNVSTSRTNIPLESSNKVQIIKSYDPKHSQHTKKSLEVSAKASDPEAQALSPKKPKNYDVHQAREFIKRQRDKRKEETKGKKCESKISADIRKEKLQELQQKATELVKKNVEAKRQRSKSRDRTSLQPTNESVIVGFNCAEKTKKHLEEPVINQIKPYKPEQNPNLLYPPEPAFVLGKKSSEATTKSSYTGTAIARNKHSKSLQNLHHLEPHYASKKPSDAKLNKFSEKLSKKETLKEQQRIVQSNVTLKATDGVALSSDDEPESKDAPSEFMLHKSLEILLKLQSPVKNKTTDQSHVTQQKTKDESQYIAPDWSDSKDAHSEPLSHKLVNNDILKQWRNKKEVVVLSNITLRRADKTAVEDRKDKIVTPEWLKDTMGQGDPYNFINTVKRQLKYVVNEKKPFCVDVGVQGYMEDNISEPKTGGISKKSDLKSFISHKCLNLDPHTIQHIELDRKNLSECKDGPTVTNHSVGSDYDSDTSKNIPSISSESGTSLRRNAEFVKQSYAFSDLKPLENAPPNLDTKRVDDIKLKKVSKPSDSSKTSTLKVPLQEDVERIKKQLFSDSDCYTSDFIPTDLSRSRDSLISFNCAKVSPNRVPDQYKTKSEISDLSPLKSKSNISLGKGAVPKSHSRISEPDRRSGSLNSGSEGDSQKGNSKSAPFYSLYSELHPSTTDPELKVVDHDLAHSGISEYSSSEVPTDGFTEVLKPKDLFTDSNYSQTTLPNNDLSGRAKTVSSLKSSENSANKLYQSKSEEIVSNKKDTVVFSKSESNIYDHGEMSLKEPKLSLNVKNRSRKGEDKSLKQALMKNISIRSGDRTSGDMNNTNEIHLKFEAEIHLLNDFNQSLRHFSEIEKAFESLRSRNDSEIRTKKVLQSRDTQTSIVTKPSTRSNTSISQISTINYSRGSEIPTDREDNSELSNRSEIHSDFKLTDQDLELSKRSGGHSETLVELTQGSDLNVLDSVNMMDTEQGNFSEKTNSVVQISQLEDVTVRSRGFRDENLAIRNFAGMSLRMFDQLIKDEDARIENWKKIVKIREQALLDRTRGELVYLEMQKKQLIETGKMPEASLIKKKQRGILLKHQQEKHEMQRLKQMQKEASAKRKTLLKKEQNLIKNQLLSDNMLSKLKSHSHRERHERRLSGPLKVIQATGSVHSETSLSKGVGGAEHEIKKITSRTCSVVLSAASKNSNSEVEPLELTLARSKNMSAGAISNMKERLLMREHALAKRRKTVEELLQWHRKLLEEEKAIEDLESKVEKIISKIPSESNEEPSKQPQDLSKSVSETSASEVNTPSMSQVVLDRLLPSKEQTSVKSSQAIKNIPQEENLSEDSNKVVSSANYSTDFDIESVHEVLPQNSDDQSNVSSISQLIENFSKIEDNILNLSLVPKRHSLESEEAVSAKSEDGRPVSSAAEEIVQDEERSEASSYSNQIASEVEVKMREESLCEVIESDKQHEQAKDSERSVIIVVEDPSEHFTASSEEHKLVSSVEIDEIKEEEDAEKESGEIAEVRGENGERFQTGQSESEAPKTPSVREELSLKEPLNEVISVSEELKDKNVPDISNKSSLSEDVANKTAEELSISVVSTDKNAEEKVSEEISAETNGEQDRLGTSTVEQTREEDSPKVHTENESKNTSIGSLLEASVKTLEDEQKTDQDEDIVVEVDHKESTASTSHQKTAENSGLLTTKEEIISVASLKPSDCETKEIIAQILSEEPGISVSKSDVSTSQQYEESEEFVASNIEIPSTSRQTEEQATTSQILSLTADDVSNPVEEEEPHSLSSISTSSIIQNDVQSSSVVAEERQLFENKTDEEKVASLSIRASGSQSGSVSEDRNRSSASITRPSSLAIQEALASDARSLTTSKGLLRGSEGAESSVVSDKLLLDALGAVSTSSEERLPDKTRSKDSKEDQSKISVSGEIDSVEEDVSGVPQIEEKLSHNEEKSKVSSDTEDGTESAGGSSRTLKNANETSLGQEKSLATEEKSNKSTVKEDGSVEVEENQSGTSLVEENSKSAARSLSVSATKSTISPEKSVFSEKPSSSSEKSSSVPEKSQRFSLNVKKRVQEILNEASPVSRGDKSPRMQDLCVMTYDLISPTRSPESGSPLEEKTKSFSLGSEAEELLRKQLAIEQEIKLLTEQQQKEQAPQFYIREIPNKPPPPYTPPSKAKTPKTASIIPSSKEEIEQITEYSAKIIHKSYLSNNLDNISISDNTLNLIAKNIDKGCYKYVFDLCKEVAIDHYGQFTEEAGPSWLHLEKKFVLVPCKPLDVKGLKKLMNKKLLELFGFEKQEKKKENAIMKWSRKKRDHVDEVLVQEMQAEENSWTNFDRDELLVKDRITNEIMDMLLKETAQVLKKTVQKKNVSQ